jgi:DNA (cytosine-5)-methyltransferase 1
MSPKVILLENVKNLVGHDKGNTFKVILETLENFGYDVVYKILNTKDYTNIPQNRERIIIVASRKDLGVVFEFPEKTEEPRVYKDVILRGNVGESFYYRDDKYNYDLLNSEMVRDDTFYQWRRQYVRENKSNVCPTLTANMGTGGHNVPLILTPEGIRKLTPRECFNLQGFPEDFKFPNVANSHLYKQAGNSVTVPLIQHIAKGIKNCIK